MGYWITNTRIAFLFADTSKMELFFQKVQLRSHFDSTFFSVVLTDFRITKQRVTLISRLVGWMNFFLETASQNLFFPGECLSKFIFPWRVPLKIYFFLESASQNLFFPGKCLSKFIFSWRRASEFFFSWFPPAPPPDH